MITINKTDPKDGYNLQRENATFMILCRNEDVYDLLETVQYLHDRYNHQYHYDFTFLNDEPFTKDFIYLLSSYIPKGNLNFGSIPKSHWSYPSFIDQQRAMQNRENSGDMPYGDSESYRHMCRFFAGFFYKHPFIRQYQYYWRIEPGIKFYCDVKYDVFKFMRENSKKYSFVLSLFEYRDTLPSLWDYVKDYMKSQDISNQDAQLIDLVQNNNQFESYNLCHFWSNFEIADLAMFDNDRYNDFFNFLDEKGGFFYERWGDAPIHSIAVSLFLSKSDLHWFDDIGYYHSPYLQCPQDSATYLQNRCTCNPDEDFSYSDLSCTSHFLDVISSDNTGSSH
ncbi:mannosyltransferase [Scheffersomyces xylosifermentans]|uniref:mannosyltransferase n=1 Tax=Scheffersomyces xylosifermentans TaxID=1304137 RepID=UPI00315CC295